MPTRFRQLEFCQLEFCMTRFITLSYFRVHFVPKPVPHRLDALKQHRLNR